jgi:hypothetical protein
MEPSVQDLLYTNVEEHLDQNSYANISKWMAVHETTFITSMKNVRKRAIQGVKSIRSYFAVGRPPGEVNPSIAQDGRQASTERSNNDSPLLVW